MRILYLLSTGLMGGVERHVQCLAKTLNSLSWTGHKEDGQDELWVRVAIIGEYGPIGESMSRDGTDVVAFGCKSGHDWRIFPRLRKLMTSWRPDIVCSQGLILFPTLYFKLFDRHTPLVRSIHTATPRMRSFVHFVLSWLGRRYDWHLPVSKATWLSFKDTYPWAEGRGSVFYNPLRISDLPPKKERMVANDSKRFVVGMVGRMAEVKGWPAFIEVCHSIQGQMSEVDFWAIGDGPLFIEMKRLAEKKGVPIRWLGQRNDAQELIGQMDVFVMTSKHEQLPTTMLEAFGMHTAICGFLPDGGVTDVLAYSRGGVEDGCYGVRKAFIKERDVGRLAQLAVGLLKSPNKRRSLVEDGKDILRSHFQAETIVPEQLIPTFREVILRKKGASEKGVAK